MMEILTLRLMVMGSVGAWTRTVGVQATRTSMAEQLARRTLGAIWIFITITLYGFRLNVN